MKKPVSLVLFAALLITLISCGPVPKSLPAEEDSDLKDRQNHVDLTVIHGTWEGSGKTVEGVTSRLRFVFQPGKVQLEKTCGFPDGGSIKSLETSAEDAAFDEGKTALTLVGGLFSFVEMDGRRCSIDFPGSLQFILRDGKIYVRGGNQERVTGLVKVADL